MGPEATPIEAEGVARSFAGREVLRGIDLQVAAGERVAVAGPNGSGKTTLLRILAGTVSPNAGSVLVCGHEPSSEAARRGLGAAIGDHRSFYRRLSARENLELFARLRLGRWRVRRLADELLEEVGIVEHADTATGQCSSGTLQRLALARALCGDPAVVLLDEPTRSMDVAGRALAWDALERRAGLAIVVASHAEDEVESADRVLRLPGQAGDSR